MLIAVRDSSGLGTKYLNLAELYKKAEKVKFPQRTLNTMTKPRFKVDPLIALILTAVVVAIIFPARGGFASGFSLATKIAIAFLFFLYGARLSPQEALQGLKHWRLHSTILAFTFAVFPLVGLALFPLRYVLGN